MGNRILGLLVFACLFTACSSEPPAASCDHEPCACATPADCPSGAACVDGRCRAASVCGDGSVQGAEECDDGNQENGDGCDVNCTESRCGNGAVGGREECDDGNQVTADGCENDCTLTECSTDDECRSLDGDCTDGFCNTSTGSCESAPVNEHGACVGGNRCSAGGTCQAGSCVGATTRDCSALDGPCTRGVCNAVSGQCEAQPVADGTKCDDGEFCNGGDTCVAGSCSAHGGDPCAGGAECQNTCDEASRSCNSPATAPCLDDGNQCTTDRCDGAGACIHLNAPNGTACDDGEVCTAPDTCSDGVCEGPGVVCNDGDPCTADTCVPGLGCDASQPAPGAPCDDGVRCNGSDRCSVAGECTLHAGNPCTTQCQTVCSETGTMCGFNSSATTCTGGPASVCYRARCDGGVCGQKWNTIANRALQNPAYSTVQGFLDADCSSCHTPTSTTYPAFGTTQAWAQTAKYCGQSSYYNALSGPTWMGCWIYRTNNNGMPLGATSTWEYADDLVDWFCNNQR